MERNIFSEGTSSCSISFSWSPGDANACTPLASRILRDVTNASERLCIPGSTLDSLNWLSEFDCVVLISRGLLPVTHLLDWPTPTHCYPPVYLSQLDSLSKHKRSPETPPKSRSIIIIYIKLTKPNQSVGALKKRQLDFWKEVISPPTKELDITQNYLMDMV